MATDTMSGSQIDPPFQTLLVSRVTAYVKDFMNQYDGSHDYAHVERVLGLAVKIATSPTTKQCDLNVVTLAALLHDVGDKKYLKPGEDSMTMVQKLLLSFGANADLASKVQIIVNAVSYSNEIQNMELIKGLVMKHPELGAVQDADRLESIGAIGIGRLFTYGGAHGGRALDDSMKLFEIKLERLEGMMKTEMGQELARERTIKLSIFKDWWESEQESARQALVKLDATRQGTL